jgi:hypothetical protein
VIKIFNLKKKAKIDPLPVFLMETKPEKKESVIIGLLERGWNPFGRPSGHILYEYAPSKWKFVNISNYKDLYKNKDLAYILERVEGTWEDNKPFFILKNKVPVSLNIAKSTLKDMSNGQELYYDPKSFFMSLDFVQMRNLSTKAAAGDFWHDFKWLFIIIGIIILVAVVAGIFFPDKLQAFLHMFVPAKAAAAPMNTFNPVM